MPKPWFAHLRFYSRRSRLLWSCRSDCLTDCVCSRMFQYTASGFLNSLIFNDEVDSYKSWVSYHRFYLDVKLDILFRPSSSSSSLSSPLSEESFSLPSRNLILLLVATMSQLHPREIDCETRKRERTRGVRTTKRLPYDRDGVQKGRPFGSWEMPAIQMTMIEKTPRRMSNECLQGSSRVAVILAETSTKVL